MGLFSSIKNAFRKVLKFVAPILTVASFIFPVLTPFAMAANAAKSLMEKPPNWMGALTSFAGSGLASGFSKALGSFGTGTSAQFAKLFGEKTSQWFGETAAEVTKKLGNNFLSRGFQSVSDKLSSAVQSETFQNLVSSSINRATKTRAEDILSRGQIEGARDAVLGSAWDWLKPTVNQQISERQREDSGFNVQGVAPISLPSLQSLSQVTPTEAVDYRPPRRIDP